MLVKVEIQINFKSDFFGSTSCIVFPVGAGVKGFSKHDV